MLVSIIIPIFNTGTFLHKCLSSVCAQTYRELQIIMIDDGSGPETAKICDELACRDSRIEIIHKRNEGVSIARNLGLKLAKGDVICFVDSDDTIRPQMIEELIGALQKHDAQIAMCDATTKIPGKPDEIDSISDFDKSCVINIENLSPCTLTRLAGSVWRCAYRRKVLLSENVKFPDGLKFSEDRIFNIIAMSQAKKIAYLKEPLYNRLIRQGSACFRYYPDMTEQITKLRSQMIPIVRNYWGEEFLKEYEGQITMQICSAITNYTAFATGESIMIRFAKIKEICNNRSLRDCIKTSGIKDLRTKAIINNNYIRLFIIGSLTNIYHKLCNQGQYQV